jgi:hypothetical protein
MKYQCETCDWTGDVRPTGSLHYGPGGISGVSWCGPVVPVETPAPVAQYDRGKFAEGLPGGRFVSVPAPRKPCEDGSEPSQDVRAEDELRAWSAPRVRVLASSESVVFDCTIGPVVLRAPSVQAANAAALELNKVLDARAAAAREEGRREAAPRYGDRCRHDVVCPECSQAFRAFEDRALAAEARATKAESALAELTRVLNALFGWNDGWLHALMHVENAVWNERANLGVAESERDRAIMERDKARAELIARAALAGQAEEKTT